MHWTAVISATGFIAPEYSTRKMMPIDLPFGKHLCMCLASPRFPPADSIALGTVTVSRTAAHPGAPASGCLEYPKRQKIQTHRQAAISSSELLSMDAMSTGVSVSNGPLHFPNISLFR
jgi:hypothetical protein